MVESFLGEARPWAMRQARRSYRHLPPELHDQAFDQAAMVMRTGAHSDLNRRALYAAFADVLDAQLRQIHVGWCLNQARVATGGSAHAAPVEPSTPQQPLTAFIDEGLGGLERAVLQLELGAGRDTSTARAALRLGPRQYARHRELGLGKLRGAISGRISGHVCDQHLQAVTLAATGDREAADRLASGPERCRACAREAAGLRRVLQQRLALAPWPLAIKPAGVLVAKLGGVGALLGKGGGAGAGVAGTATSAKVIAGVMATAALATGGIAAIEADSDSDPAKPAKSVVAPVTEAVKSPPSVSSQAGSGASSTASESGSRKAADRRKAAFAKSAAPAPATEAPATESAPRPSSSDPAAAKPADPVSKAVEETGKTVDGVKQTVDEVTSQLPAPVPQVAETVVPEVEKAVEGVTGTVEGAAGTVDELLTP